MVLVDDDEILLAHYVQTLTAVGMEAIAIRSPSLLLEALAEHQPEIVLLDLHMPECNGIEALKVIRQEPQFYSLPVVFLSTESGLETQQNAMQIGAVSCKNPFRYQPDHGGIHTCPALSNVNRTYSPRQPDWPS